MAKKTAIKRLIIGSNGLPETVYFDQKTKKRITNLKGYQILDNSNTGTTVESKETKGSTKGFAVPLLVRGSDGLNKTIYVDPNTGKQVNPEGKEVSDQFTQNLGDLGLLPKEEKKKKDTGKGGKKREASDRNVAGGFEGPSAYQGGPTGKSKERTAANDYGYIDKPGIMSVAGFLPGPLGLAGKAANLAINASNVAATNKAREMLGFEDKANLGGVLMDRKGYIGDLTYEGETSPVGFEATTKDKRTTLTPNEARMRTELLGAKEATPAEKKSNVAEFRKENPRSLISRVFGDVGEGAAKGVKEGVKKGLASLSPSFERGVSYTHPERGPVTQGLSENTINTMDALVNQTGNLNVTSAYRDPQINAAVGGARGSQHLTGDAFDLSMRNLSNEQKADLVQRAIMSGAMEIGTYPDGSLHIGTTQRSAPLDPELTGGVTAMYDRSRYGYENAPSWFKEGLESTDLAAIPEERPGDLVAANNINPVGPATAASAVDLSRVSSFDPDTRRQMAMTLAGEIDPSITDLSTPEGIREAEAIMSTMENRAGRYGTIQEAIGAPGQFSTWGSEQAAATAAKNYTANPELYDRLVDTYAQDQRKNLGFTSYYNPSIANPGWGSALVSPQDIGPHRFGSLPEYGSSFGMHFGQTGMSKGGAQNVPSIGPRPATSGTEAKASTSVSLGKPTQGFGGTGSLSDENANRSTTESRSMTSGSGESRSSGFGFGGDRSSSGKSSYGTTSGSGGRGMSSGGLSSSSGSGGGFGVGGDRSSSGKSSYGGMSTSSGSTGGFGVGGDRSSEGKSSYGGGSTGQSKGAESRSDGWT